MLGEFSPLLQPRAGGFPDRVFALGLVLVLGRVGLVEAEHVEVLGVRELHILHGGVEGGRPLLQGRPYDLGNLRDGRIRVSQSM